MIELELPFPPSANTYYRHVGPRTLISRKGRAFRRQVCSILAELGIKHMEGPLEVRIEVYLPDRRKRDIDNIQKSLLDALEHGGAYFDDSQIVKLVTEKRKNTPGGKTLVYIRKK